MHKKKLCSLNLSFSSNALVLSHTGHKLHFNQRVGGDKVCTHIKDIKSIKKSLDEYKI